MLYKLNRARQKTAFFASAAKAPAEKSLAIFGDES
jgi:hypothetical protein